MELSPGLAEIIAEGKASQEMLRHSPIPQLYVLPAGEMHEDRPGPYDCWGIDYLLKLMNSEPFTKECGFVVFDAPPLMEQRSSVHLARLVDGVVLVVEAEKDRWEIVNRVKDELHEAKAHVLGVILNKRRFPIPKMIYRRL
jgi:Mrp family chromosome partitioning ATPase